MIRIFCLLIVILLANNPKVVMAQSEETAEKSCDRLSLDSATMKLTAEPGNSENRQISEDPANIKPKIAVAGIAIPSLWWAKEQFDPFGGKLISNWLTDTKIKQIDLTVNWQLWTLLDYLGRYRFINQFGTVARQHGYSLHIYNQQQKCLALYEYNDTVNPPKWEITIEGVAEDSLQVEPSNGQL
jgi:hypothetical protein